MIGIGRARHDGPRHNSRHNPPHSLCGRLGARRGFSLVELLVALALLSVVVLIMGFLMNSMRMNSEALLAGFTEPDPGADAAELEEDLRRMLRSRPDPEIPVFEWDEEVGLMWRRETTDARGRALPTQVRVLHDSEAETVLRVLRQAGGGASTNVVWRGVSALRWTFWDGETWQTAWPPGEDGDRVPRLVRAELSGREGAVLRHDMLVPAAMRVEPDSGPGENQP